MMIHAYSEFYLFDAKQNLAEMFDYAIRICEMDVELVSKLFVQSGYADKFRIIDCFISKLHFLKFQIIKSLFGN